MVSVNALPEMVNRVEQFLLVAQVCTVSFRLYVSELINAPDLVSNLNRNFFETFGLLHLWERMSLLTCDVCMIAYHFK